MKMKAILPIIGLMALGALSLPRPAAAALPCDRCHEIAVECEAAGNSFDYCYTHRPAGCYGCPPGVRAEITSIKDEPIIKGNQKAEATVAMRDRIALAK